MKETICLALEGATVLFTNLRRRKGFVHFDVEFELRELHAVIPPVRGCSLSDSDVCKLVERIEAWLQGEDAPGTFTSYDAFFVLSFLGGDQVRMMASYRPTHPLRLGLEGSVSESAMEAFRDGWRAQLL